MKRTLLTALIVGMTTLAFGQKAFILAHQDKRGFLAVSAGVSLPVGQFASCSPLNNQAGMAMHGMTTSLSAGVRVAGPVGFMVQGEQRRYAVQTYALLNNLYRTDSDTWTASADDWSVTTVMGGPYVSVPLGRFSLDTRFLIGRAKAVLPNTSMSGNFGNIDVSMHTTGSLSTALAMGGGLSLRYRLGRSVSMHLNGDYSHARFLFNNLTSTAQSDNGRSESSRYSSSRTVCAVSVSAGVALLFGNSNRPF